MTNLRMKHHRKNIILILFTLTTLALGVETSFSQNGNPFLTHYSLPDGVSNQNWGFVQGENGLMYILNRKGIMSFDGLQWENLGVTGRPIAITYSNWLFYCTDSGVGYFHKEIDGTYKQKILIESERNNYFYKFRRIEGGILVVSPQAICHISTEGEIKIDTLYHDERPEVFISDFFQVDGQMYHVKNRALIYHNKPDGGYEMLAGLPIGEDMTFSFVHGNSVFFGSTSNKLYKFDGSRLSPFVLKDQSYLDASLMNGGISINQNAFAISTSNGGTLIVNSTDGETVNTLNYFNGLPDDEIFSLGTDGHGGLWISHAMGITRADLKIPIKNFSYYTGIRGYLLSCAEYDGRLYVGSSEGLYYLAEERDYRTREVIIQRRQREVRVEIPSEPAETQQSVEEKKKNFLQRLFNRKDDVTEEVESQIRVSVEAQSSTQERELTPVRKRIYELQSVTHLYKKVVGVEGKVRQIFVHKNKLYAATNLGLFEVNGESARKVIADKNIVFAETSSYDDSKILLGTDNGAYYAHEMPRSWSLTQILDQQNQLVTSIVQINDKDFLLTNEFDVFLVAGVGTSGYGYSKLHIPGTELSSPHVRLINGTATAFSSLGAFTYDSNKGEFFQDKSLITSSRFSINFYQYSWSWLKQNGNWISLNAVSSDSDVSAALINLLENPNYIYLSSSNRLFVINANSQIYRVDIEEAKISDKQISLFLKRVLDKEGNLLTPKNIELTYASNALNIRISAPSYLKEGSVLFQYRIIGLMENWSEWTSESSIDLRSEERRVG